MKTERVKIYDLKAPPRNVRKHNSKQITEFKRSLTMFGQIRPVVIDEEGVIWCGNGLVEAARELGWETVDVYRLSGLSVKQKHKLMITDNRIYSLGFDDYDSINKIIEEIGDFDIPGFDTETLQNMFGNLENELESFGVLTDDEKQSARQAQESRESDLGVSTYAKENESAGTAQESTEVRDGEGTDGGPVPNEPTEGGGRVIKCPHCGKEICC